MGRPSTSCVYGEPFTADDVWDPVSVVLVVGRRGCGKTSLVLEELLESLDGPDAILAFDPHHEYGPEEEALTIARFKTHAPTLKGEEASLALVSIETKEVKPVADEDEDDEEWLDELAVAMRRFVSIVKKHVRNTVIIIEESGVVESSKKAGMALSYLATQSRHWNCPLVFVAQRAAQVPPTVKAQATCIVSFKQSRVADIEALEEEFELEAPELAGRIAKLKKFEYIVWRSWDEA